MSEEIALALFDDMCSGTSELICSDGPEEMLCVWDDATGCNSIISVLIDSECDQADSETECTSAEGNCAWGTGEELLEEVMFDVINNQCLETTSPEDCYMPCMWNVEMNHCMADMGGMDEDNEGPPDCIMDCPGFNSSMSLPRPSTAGI